MSNDFHKRIVKVYVKNLFKRKILKIILKNEFLNENATNIFFSTILVLFETNSYMKSRAKKNLQQNFAISNFNHELNKLIYYFDSLTNFRRLCILTFCVENVFKIAHDDDHLNFVRCCDIVL